MSKKSLRACRALTLISLILLSSDGMGIVASKVFVNPNLSRAAKASEKIVKLVNVNRKASAKTDKKVERYYAEGLVYIQTFMQTSPVLTDEMFNQQITPLNPYTPGLRPDIPPPVVLVRERVCPDVVENAVHQLGRPARSLP